MENQDVQQSSFNCKIQWYEEQAQKSHSRDGCDDEEVWSPTLPHIVQDSASNPSIPPKWNRYHTEQEYASSLCLN